MQIEHDSKQFFEFFKLCFFFGLFLDLVAFLLSTSLDCYLRCIASGAKLSFASVFKKSFMIFNFVFVIRKINFFQVS